MRTDKKRITFQVDSGLRERIDKHIPWGQQRMVFESITKDLAQMLEDNDANLVIAAIVSDEVKLSNIVDYSKHKEDKEKETNG